MAKPSAIASSAATPNALLLVAPGDSAALAEAILVNDAALRRRLGEEAARTSDRFHPALIVRRHVEYFQHVVG